jgi:hypothetical protein
MPPISPSRGQRGEGDDRPQRGAIWPEARASCSGHGLQIGGDAQLDLNEKKITPHISLFDKTMAH